MLEPVYIRDCEVCNQPRIATGDRLQSKEGDAHWTDTTVISIRCGCGQQSADSHDTQVLREMRFEKALDIYASNPRASEQLRNEALNQCHGLTRAGVKNPFRSLKARMQGHNRAQGRKDDELTLQYVVEGCVMADRLLKNRPPNV